MPETSKPSERILDVLETLQTAAEPLGVNEIAALCGLPPATAYRALQTLCARGWAFQGADEKYRAGARLAYAGGGQQFLRLLRDTAFFVMRRYAAEAGEAMNLAVRDLDRCTILVQARTERLIDYIPPTGTSSPFHASACGKVLLSELPAAALDDILAATDFRPFTEKTVTDAEHFRAVLDEVRENGYATDAFESSQAGFCVAVPVRDTACQIIAAVSYSGFLGDVPPEKLAHFLDLLKKCSAEITEKIFGQH